ncbi:MAG: addiction module protein [Bacteroidota bacterium]
MKALYLQSDNDSTTMSTIKIREEVQEYLNKADERFINLVYGMIQADKSGPLLSATEREELDRRIARHKSGESKSYTWDEVKSSLKD